MKAMDLFHDGILKETVMVYPEKFQLVGWLDVQGQAW